jgi:hypothetical protein
MRLALDVWANGRQGYNALATDQKARFGIQRVPAHIQCSSHEGTRTGGILLQITLAECKNHPTYHLRNISYRILFTLEALRPGHNLKHLITTGVIHGLYMGCT